MYLRNTTLILFLACATLLPSCKTVGPLFAGKVKPTTAAALDTEIRERIINCETFSAKAKVDVTSLSGSSSFSVSIDIRRDSLIGLSLRVVGVEGARVRITPDSIEILDRVNQQYLPRDYLFLRDSLNLNLSFTDLQNLILGNPLAYDSASLTQGESDEYYILLAQKGVYKNTLTLSTDYAILRMFIEDLYAKRNLTLNYAGYEKIDGRQFALNRNIILNAREDLQADIAFLQVEFDQPFDFSFSINPKYQRID